MHWTGHGREEGWCALYENGVWTGTNVKNCTRKQTGAILPSKAGNIVQPTVTSITEHIPVLPLHNLLLAANSSVISPDEIAMEACK